MSAAVTTLAPEVIDRLRILQDQDRPVSVDEVLQAANLNHLNTNSSSQLSVEGTAPSAFLEKLKPSHSATIAERRRQVPLLSSEKLKLYNSQINQVFVPSNNTTRDENVLRRLEEENARMPPQDSEEYMLARLERQNALLNADPKSITIESNRLQADFDTIRNLVTDATFSPTSTVSYEETIQSLLTKKPLTSNFSATMDDLPVEWEFWQTIVQDFPTAVSKLPHLLTAKLRYGGIPHKIRGVIWQSMCQSSSLNLESMYGELSICENASYDRVIQRDLSRTFPQLDMFKDDGGDGQQAMGRLLKAYSLYDAHVGYCQGLAFLVGPLLMTMPENQAFCVFVRLMETYEMRTMFTLNMEGLHLRLHQFGTLLTQLCPRLSEHLNNHSIHTAMFASQWYLTLFAYSFPISLVLRIYDLVFAEGAVETITRVAIAIMQKNEDTLLSLTDFEQLMMYLSSRKLYEVAYDSDPEPVISDAMALSTIITKQKMDSIQDNYYAEMENEKTSAQQVLAIRFGKPSSPTSPTFKKSKRDSWFPWNNSSSNSAVVTENTVPENVETVSVESKISQEEQVRKEKHQDRAVSKLHEQIEDLVTVLSQLQKENSKISEDLMAKQMKEMDLMTERQQLLKRNTVLENKLKKATGEANQSSPVESIDGDHCSQEEEEEESVVVDKQQQIAKLAMLEKQAEFRHFVDSLKSTGDFGSLIAGALTTSSHNATTASEPSSTVSDENIANSLTGSNKHYSATAKQVANDDSMDDVTAELVNIKLANFEMGLKYQHLCQEHENLKKNYLKSTEGQADLLNKVMSLQTTIESLQIDKESSLEEIDDLLETNQDINDKNIVLKKTCSDLQLEKLNLDAEINRLATAVKELEEQRLEYLMPRGSFTEEVFAAHQTLFGSSMTTTTTSSHSNSSSKPSGPSRRHTFHQMTAAATTDEPNYQQKYIESDLQCRELEKMLAETKFRLVELEANSHHTVYSAGSLSLSLPTSPCSPRGSLQQPGRPSSTITLNQQNKRRSLSNMRANTRESVDGSNSMLTPRESTDILQANSTTPTLSSKRSSVYSRFFNVLGTGPLPEEEIATTPQQTAA